MKEMQVYSKIILQTCFVDICAICVFVIVQPTNKWPGKTLAPTLNRLYFVYCSGCDVKFKHQLLLIGVVILPNVGLNICAHISNCPTPENEHLTNYELAKMLELDNYTIENYVVGLRSFNSNLSIFTANYASTLSIINYIIIIFCSISIQIRVYKHCKGVEMTQLRNMNKQMSFVLGAQVTILSVRNYRQIIFRCKNSSNIQQVTPMPETSMPDRTIHNI
uniref:Glycoprotein n=1 Tax=Meloidogyne hapla TaxID=6305 RepID=A0A1I8AY97_MELHA